ncbi:UNVERIFIED_CONTAM: Structural maintenance of chromosomes protein 2 [Siphonaria sp. JEL0065]|nr:Structural maintenance of chromosomes protein 2 [Siphonaria sp. JEL0065]
MYIEEIIIDGFKSYATRTVISGWDPQFNAITGLNGSGKSNILDSICFVLGISTLSHVRAANLTDLVYKRGQAGITKATVSIVFNNEDKDNAPIGYQDLDKITVTRQLVVGGTNKYLINGAKKTQQDVASLFHSVQLNINNPHFIIMQGKITKVLNMKPVEILAMVEEAAGTRMFEDRKEKAVKVMGKKETKMDEIQNLLHTEIQPKLASLRDKKRDYMEFQKLETELSQIQCFLTAHDYWACGNNVAKFEQESIQLRDQIEELQESNQKLNDENIHVASMIETLSANKQNKGSVFHQLETESKEVNKELVKINTQVDLKASSIKEESASLKALEKSRLESSGSLDALAESVEKVQSAFDKKKAEYEMGAKNLEKKQDLLQTLTTGVASAQGHENGYMDQLQEARNNLSTSNSAINQAKIKINHLKEELKAKAPKAKKAEESNKSMVDSLAVKRDEVAAIRTKVEKMAVPNIDSLYEKRGVQSERVGALKRQLAKVEKDIQGHLFRYTNGSINPSDVKGIIAELIQIPATNLESVTAIEGCAGGRLFNVVVTTDDVGAKLLDPKQTKLSKRVTLMPMNKIMPTNIDPNAYSTSAKQVAFNKDVRMKCLTLDGDVYDPSGSLSGGSRKSSTLTKFQEYTQVKKAYLKEDTILNALLEEIRAAEVVVGEYQKAGKKLELAVHECGLLEKQIGSNSNSQVIFQVEKIQKDIEAETKRIEEAKGAVVEFTEKCKSLEVEMQKFSTHKEETLETLKKEIQAEKKVLADESKKFQAEELKVQTVAQEKIQLEKEIQSFDANEATIKAAIAGLTAELEAMKEKQMDMKDLMKTLEEKLAVERKAMLSHDSEMQSYEKTLKSNQKKLSDLGVALMRLQNEYENGSVEAKKSAALLKDITANPENAWISDLKAQFGVDGGRFDFAKQNISELRKKVSQLTERHKATSRTLDRSVMDQFDRIEKKESSLVAKISTVLKDKNKIEETIDSLEKYKIDKLLKTWEKVSRDFGLIFGDLLPGNTAKLTPADGKNIGSGLEVQVSLGGVWKENLTELSGGQRSLVALSLILALLQFKPAPMYILDEVDSALDESHTQNIGQLLKNRFKGAQFILVSLKDGMYTNANVLFRTKFRDGVSTIERFAQQNTAGGGSKKR